MLAQGLTWCGEVSYGQAQADQVLFNLVVGVEAGDDFLADIAALVHVDGEAEPGIPGIVILSQLASLARLTPLDAQDFPGLLADGLRAAGD